jgi:hypothetical protein
LRGKDEADILPAPRERRVKATEPAAETQPV